MIFSDMSCLATLRASKLRCSLLTVLIVLCGSPGRGNVQLPMYHNGHRISNGGSTIVRIVGMLPWSLVLLLRRVASVASVISAGRLGI